MTDAKTTERYSALGTQEFSIKKGHVNRELHCKLKNAIIKPVKCLEVAILCV